METVYTTTAINPPAPGTIEADRDYYPAIGGPIGSAAALESFDWMQTQLEHLRANIIESMQALYTVAQNSTFDHLTGVAFWKAVFAEPSLRDHTEERVAIFDSGLKQEASFVIQAANAYTHWWNHTTAATRAKYVNEIKAHSEALHRTLGRAEISLKNASEAMASLAAFRERQGVLDALAALVRKTIDALGDLVNKIREAIPSIPWKGILLGLAAVGVALISAKAVATRAVVKKASGR